MDKLTLQIWPNVSLSVNNKEWRQLLEVRLDEWADWQRLPKDFGLGFKKETMLYKLQRDGVVLRGTPGSGINVDNNVSAEEMEGWVMVLHQMDENLSDVIRAKYIYEPKLPNDLIAKKLRISVRTFEARLATSRSTLIGMMVLTNNAANDGFFANRRDNYIAVRAVL